HPLPRIARFARRNDRHPHPCDHHPQSQYKHVISAPAHTPNIVPAALSKASTLRGEPAALSLPMKTNRRDAKDAERLNLRQKDEGKNMMRLFCPERTQRTQKRSISALSAFFAAIHNSSAPIRLPNS